MFTSGIHWPKLRAGGAARRAWAGQEEHQEGAWPPNLSIQLPPIYLRPLRGAHQAAHDVEPQTHRAQHAHWLGQQRLGQVGRQARAC